MAFVPVGIDENSDLPQEVTDRLKESFAHLEDDVLVIDGEPVGVGGGGSASEVRADTTGTYSYMGTAPNGTAESASGWAVTRITLVSPPVIETASGAWDDRASLSYS